jgi:branched-chain amino acid transport system substrate-binding protein
MIIRFIVTLLLVFNHLTLLTAQGFQDEQKIAAEFNRAVKLFDAKEYGFALSGFEKIITNYELNSKTTASCFFKIKILVERNNLYEARKEILKFVQDFPASKYIDEVRKLSIKAYLKDDSYFEAFREAVFLIDNTSSIVNRLEVKEIGENIANNFLGSSEVNRLRKEFSSDKSNPYLLLLLGKSYLNERDAENAETVLSEVLRSYPTSDEYAEAKNLYDNPFVRADNYEGGTYIGVMLPLQKDGTDNTRYTASDEILEGVKFAVSEFNKGRDDKIGIVIRDTRNDADRINEIKNEFSSNPDIKVILGPVFSNEVRVTIKSFEGTGLTIISPTATDNDLTSISEDFFQANPPLSVRGKMMAQYVYFVENKTLMGVLNAIDGYSPLLAATFIEEFEKLGGTIKVKATYKSNSYSLSDQIFKIASVETIQGLYIPLADKNDAAAILSQMGQDSLYIPIYGNQDWFSAKGFESAPGLSNMLTFSSDYFIDFSDRDYQRFNENFSNIVGSDPGRNVLYGYDLAKYLLTVMRNSAPNREGIKRSILSGIVSNGFHNNITFDESRINRFINIVRYKDGVFELIEKFRSSD